MADYQWFVIESEDGRYNVGGVPAPRVPAVGEIVIDKELTPYRVIEVRWEYERGFGVSPTVVVRVRKLTLNG